jgi:hypothetical protein
MCFGNTTVVDHRQNIEPCAVLGVQTAVVWYIGRRITPGIKYNAMVSAAEKSNLWLPTAIISCEFVHKNHSVAFS